MGGDQSKEEESVSIDSVWMDDLTRSLNQVVSLIRRDFRILFGVSRMNQWGHFLDKHMSELIHHYTLWYHHKPSDHTNQVLKGRHRKRVTALAVSGDSHYLYSGSQDGYMMIHDLVDWSSVKRFQAHSGVVNSLDYHSSLVASAGKDKVIRLWNAYDDCRFVCTLKGHSGPVQSVEFDSTGKLLVSSSNKWISLWSVLSGEIMSVFSGHKHTVRSVNFAGRMLASGSADHTIKSWKLSSDRPSKTVERGSDGTVMHSSVNSNATLLAVCSKETCFVYSWPNLVFLPPSYPSNGSCDFHPFHPDMLAVNRTTRVGGRMIEIWDTKYGKRVRVFEQAATVVRFSPDGHRLISAGSDRMITVWDVSDFLSDRSFTLV